MKTYVDFLKWIIVVEILELYSLFREAFDACKDESKTGKVYVETDMRAHANPTRMRNIEKATENLIVKREVTGFPCL